MKALDHIAAPLRTFLEPQVDQLGLHMVAGATGIAGAYNNERGSARLWATTLGNDCLLSVHAVTLKNPTMLTEDFSDYACVCLLSAPSVANTPAGITQGLLPRDNLMVFSQNAGRSSMELTKDSLYESVNICLTPPFFARLAHLYPGEFDDLADDMLHTHVNDLPAELRTVLHGLIPFAQGQPANNLMLRARVYEAIGLLAAHLGQTRQARAAQGCPSQRELVRQARALASARLDAPLTLNYMAHELAVSRSHLCAAFRAETGMGLGAYMRQIRMERAQDLLTTTDQGILDVAHAVGYANAASFTEAFTREVGMSPARWRAHVRG